MLWQLCDKSMYMCTFIYCMEECVTQVALVNYILFEGAYIRLLKHSNITNLNVVQFKLYKPMRYLVIGFSSKLSPWTVLGLSA